MDDENKMLAVPDSGVAVQTRGSEIITARKVEVRRSMERVLKNMTFLAREAGDAYYYSIPFKSKDKNTGKYITSYVEGPSVTLTMDLAREYGNCVISCDRIIEEPNAWFFEARFTDLETGYSLVRSFRQRRDQETGMERRDPGRAQDILFQIGQSKALRNVIRNALHFHCDRAFEEAKASKLSIIENNPQKARDSIVNGLAKMGADLKTVEQSVGRTAKYWTPNDMAGIYGRLRAVNDQQVTFEDAFAVDDVQPEEKVEAKMTVAKPKAEPKKEAAPAKKAEPKEEPEPKQEKASAAPKQEESKPADKQEMPDIPADLDRREKAPTPAEEEEGAEVDVDDPGPSPDDEAHDSSEVDDDTGEEIDPETGEVKSLFGDD